MNSLRVLITNIALTHRSGTEMYVHDVARGLLRLGHTPICYSTLLGETAKRIADSGVAVVEDLSLVTQPPDVIHGNHHPETMTALLHFSHVPALFMCHDRVAWHDEAPVFPRIRRYVAVDECCAERLNSPRVLLHGVDISRFRPRPPLPRKPQRALVFSHQASGDNYLPAIENVCVRARLTLDVVGHNAGHSAFAPEEVLPRYDVVFAKARCAQEALAVGCAVVLCDAVGAGELVTTSNWEQLRRWNYGRRMLCHPIIPEHLFAQVSRYDADDANEVARRYRNVANLSVYLLDLVSLYQEVIDEHHKAGPTDWAEEQRAIAHYLRHLSPKKLMDEWHLRAMSAEQMAADAKALRQENQTLRSERDHLANELTAIQSTRTWRLRQALRWPLRSPKRDRV